MFKDGFTVLNDFTKCSCFTAVASSPFSCNANKAAFKRKRKIETKCLSSFKLQSYSTIFYMKQSFRQSIWDQHCIIHGYLRTDEHQITFIHFSWIRQYILDHLYIWLFFLVFFYTTYLKYIQVYLFFFLPNLDRTWQFQLKMLQLHAIRIL